MRLGDLVRATTLGGLVAGAMVAAAPVGAVPITVGVGNIDTSSPPANNPQTVTISPYFQFTLTGAPANQNIGSKNVGGVNAIGVTGGASGNEIDIGQSITVNTFSLPVSLASFTLAFLFDGPEYDDVQEVARVTVQTAGGPLTGTLTANFTAVAGPYTATWSLPSPLGTIVSPTGVNGNPTSTGAAVWTVNNPFGNVLITSATFTAIRGVGAAPCDGVTDGSTCTNQSDFGIAQLQFAVPEPGMLALLGSGLIGLGAVLRRRREA